MRNTKLLFGELQIMTFSDNHFFYPRLAKKTLQITMKRGIPTSRLKRDEIIHLLRECPNFKYEKTMLQIKHKQNENNICTYRNFMLSLFEVR
jgi:hypothetical protein